MNVLVDSCVWSLLLRRTKVVVDDPVVSALSNLIKKNRVCIVGPIRQEVLSGIKNQNSFSKLKEYLKDFLDLPLKTLHFERAAEIGNLCRSHGIQASAVDYLICAVSEIEGFELFTTDKDFTLISKYIPIQFYHFTH